MASSGGSVKEGADTRVELEEGRPVGCFRILSQAEYDQCDYPVYEGTFFSPSITDML